MADSAPPSPVLPVQDFAGRLERLERSLRRYRLTTGAIAIGCAAWAACSGGPQAKNVLSAERFVLVAADGSERATLELDPKGNPMLLLRNGQSSALLTANGPSLLLRGPDGKTGAFVGVDGKNSSRLELCSSRVLDGVRVTAHEDGSSGVYVLDTNGRERGSLESFAKGGSGLHFRDSQGNVRANFGVDESNLPNLVMLDERGTRRAGMVVQEDGNGLLELDDEKGQPRFQLTTLFDGSPRLELKSADGATSFQAP